MTVSAANDVCYDPYDIELNADPYPMFRRLREELPPYYNSDAGRSPLRRAGSINELR